MYDYAKKRKRKRKSRKDQSAEKPRAFREFLILTKKKENRHDAMQRRNSSQWETFRHRKPFVLK